MSVTAAATIHEELIPLDDRGPWEAALESVPHAFAHTWTNCHAMAQTSGLATFLYSFESPGARIVCPLAERPIGEYADVVTPYGFSGFVGTGDCPSFSERWREFAERAGYVCGYLIVNPVMGNETYFGEAAGDHKNLFVFDLTLEVEELFARLSTNRRRQIRRAQADGDAIVRDREALSEFFVETYPDFIARRNATASVYDLGERSMRELCASQQVLLLGAQREGRLRSVSLFGFTSHAGDFLFNASLPGEEGHSAMLIWGAVRELKERGVPTLNLGGGVTDDDSLTEFKRRFGTERVPLRNIKHVYRPDVYDALCREAGVDPATTSYFPAYRAAT